MTPADGLIEIRIHGRGGQGNVVAAYLLAAAAVHAGLCAQAFPAFGAERRGAPVAAFVRCRRAPILRRSEVSAPNFIIVQDLTLLAQDATLDGLSAKAGVLVNTGRHPSLHATLPGNWRTAHLPATKIAEDTIGRPVPNVPLLAAFLSLTELAPSDALAAAIDGRFSGATAAHNRRAAELGAAAVSAGAWADEAVMEDRDAGRD